jgi:hypothetical protein
VLSGPEVMLSSSASATTRASPVISVTSANPPSLRFVREMLQAVAAGVPVSLVSDPEGKDDVAARAGGLGEGVAE